MAALAEAGYVITISDLYAEHFNPVASAADFVVRRDSGYLSYALEGMPSNGICSHLTLPAKLNAPWPPTF